MTNHAKQRALARGIKKSDSERVINHPTETIQDAYNGNYKSFGETATRTESPYMIIVHTEFLFIMAFTKNDFGIQPLT
jgi:hypothetical protein